MSKNARAHGIAGGHKTWGESNCDMGSVGPVCRLCYSMTHYVAFRTHFVHLKNKNNKIHIITSQPISHSSFEMPYDNTLQIKSSNGSDAPQARGGSKLPPASSLSQRTQVHFNSYHPGGHPEHPQQRTH